MAEFGEPLGQRAAYITGTDNSDVHVSILALPAFSVSYPEDITRAE